MQIKKKILLPVLIASTFAISAAVVGCTNGSTDDGDDNQDPTTYSVSYSVGEGTGTAPTGESYAVDEKFTLPGQGKMSKDDYTFDGWSYNSQKYEAGFEFTMPANDVEFVAQWKSNSATDPAKHLTVTYKAGEYGTGTDIVQDKGIGGTISVANNLDTSGWTIEDGYTISGWKIENDSTDKVYNPDESYNLTANVVFVAQYGTTETPPEEEETYTVTYSAGVGAVGTSPDPVSYKAGDTVVLIEKPTSFAYPVTDYVFYGWYVKGAYNTTYQPGDPYPMPEGDVEFVAKWGMVQYKVTYKPGDHATGTSITQTKDKGNISIGNNLDISNWVIDTGYSPSYWTIEGDQTGTPYNANTSYNLTGDVVFVLKCQQLMYVFDNDYMGWLELYMNDEPYALLYGTEEDPIAFFGISKIGNNITFDDGEGHTFTGTYIDNTLAIKIRYNNISYFFNVDTEYTVRFTAGGATGAVPPVQEHKAGESFQLEAPTNLSKAGHTFDGWKYSTKVYKAGDTFTMPASPDREAGVTLVAQWKPDDPNQSTEPTISFDANGGTGTAPTYSLTQNGSVYSFTFPECSFNPPTAKTFLTWEYNGTQYAAGATLTFNSGDTVTIKALWQNDNSQGDVEVEGTAFYGSLSLRETSMYTDEYVEYVKFVFSEDMSAVTYYYYEKEDFNTYVDNATLKHKTVSFSEGEHEDNTFDPDGVSKAAALNGVTHFFFFNAGKTQVKICNVNGEDYAYSALRGSQIFAAGAAEGDWVHVTIKEMSALNGKQFVAESNFTCGTTEFVGIQFVYSSALGEMKLKTIYLSSSGQETVLTSTISIASVDAENGYLWTFNSGSYNITIGKKDDGNWYLVEFAYKSNGISSPIKLTERTA